MLVVESIRLTRAPGRKLETRRIPPGRETRCAPVAPAAGLSGPSANQRGEVRPPGQISRKSKCQLAALRPAASVDRIPRATVSVDVSETYGAIAQSGQRSMNRMRSDGSGVGEAAGLGDDNADLRLRVPNFPFFQVTESASRVERSIAKGKTGLRDNS